MAHVQALSSILAELVQGPVPAVCQLRAVTGIVMDGSKPALDPSMDGKSNGGGGDSTRVGDMATVAPVACSSPDCNGCLALQAHLVTIGPPT